MRHEVELVKAALLYADSIEILSLGSRTVREYAKFGRSDPTALAALVTSLDDATLSRMGAGAIAENRDVVRGLLSLDPDLIRGLAVAKTDRAELEDFATMLDEQRSTMASSMAEIRRITDEIREQSGVAELESVLDGRLVRFNENVEVNGESHEVIGSFVDEMKRYLRDPSIFVLLDEQMASMARSLIDEGHVQLPARSVSNAAEAVLGTGLLSRLPAFPSIALSEILDLRKDLDGPLERYRRKVAHLRGLLQTTPFDEYVQAEVDAVWRAEVAPTITEIRAEMADHGLIREILKNWGRNVSDVVKGWAPAGLTVLTLDQLQLQGVLTTGLTASAAVAPGVAQGIMDSLAGKSAVRGHDLYYLYELDRRTS